MTERPPDDEQAERPSRAARLSGPPFSRRLFLVGAASAAGAAYVQAHPFLRKGLAQQSIRLTDATSGPAGNTGIDILPIGDLPFPDLFIAAERSQDLVLLDFAFYKFAVVPGTPPAITPTEADNVVLVQFPPQALAEGEYPWQTPTSIEVDAPPVLSDLSGPSRLCFNIPMGSSVPLTTMTVQDLLDWSSWNLLVPAVAQVHGPHLESFQAHAATNNPGNSGNSGELEFPLPSEPTLFETSIEFPYAMFIAPVVYASGSPIYRFSTGFSSRSAPLVSPDGVVDLWSTSLVGAGSDFLVEPINLNEPAYVPPISAVWALDYSNPDPFLPPPHLDATPETEIEYGFEVIQ